MTDNKMEDGTKVMDLATGQIVALDEVTFVYLERGGIYIEQDEDLIRLEPDACALLLAIFLQKGKITVGQIEAVKEAKNNG